MRILRGLSRSWFRWFGLLGMLWLSGGLGCAQVIRDSDPETPTAQIPQVIWSVNFAFFQADGKPTKKSHLTSSALLKAMETAETSGSLAVFRLSFVGKFRVYKRTAMRADLRRIKKLYRYHGFYDTQAFFDENTDLKVIAGPNRYRKYARVSLRIRIIEGPQVKIAEVKYLWPKRYVLSAAQGGTDTGTGVNLRAELAEGPSPIKGVLDNPILKVGKGFSTPDYQLWKGVLLKRLQDRSYALAQLRGRVIINKEKRTAEVRMEIVPLVKCKFGDVKIVNNKRVKSELIRELLKFKENQGEYNVQRLVDTQRGLFALGMFRTVSVKPDLKCAKYRLARQFGGTIPSKYAKEASPCFVAWKRDQGKDAPLAIPILVDVQEDKFQLIKLGIGLIIDGQRNQVGVSLGWNFLHFLGGLRELQLQASPGWAFLPDVIRRFDNGPDVTASITFKQPVFMDRQAELGARLLYRRTEEIGASDYQTLTPSIWFSRPIWGRLTGRISFNVELAFDVQDPLTLNRENYQLAYFEQQLVWDLRDNPLNTTRGVFFALTMQQAFFGSFQYFKITPEFRFFVSLPGKIVVAGRLLYGAMFSQRTGSSPSDCLAEGCLSVNDILRKSPFTQRFFSGGANSVRGWTARYLGPIACRIQSQEYQNVTTAEPVTTTSSDGTQVTGVGVRVVRQVKQKTENVPDPEPKTPLSGRESALYPALKRGETCRPAAVEVMQDRSDDLASRRSGLPLDGRPGVLPLSSQQALQAVPTGGHHLMEASLEVRIPLSFITSSLGVVFFIDAGVVQLDPQFEVLAELIPSISVGGGIRFQTPVGALRLDIAGRISPDDDRYPLQAHWQIHFSFGEAF